MDTTTALPCVIPPTDIAIESNTSTVAMGKYYAAFIVTAESIFCHYQYGHHVCHYATSNDPKYITADANTDSAITNIANGTATTKYSTALQ